MAKVAALGYLVVRGPVAEWREFATDALGLQLAEGGNESSVRFRSDDRAWRIEVQDGPPGPDCLIAVGLEAANEQDLDGLIADLQTRGVAVEEDEALATQRGVRRLVRFPDRNGNQLEVFSAASHTSAPFVSPRGVRFLCGDLGLGHVFLSVVEAPEAAEFYQDALGFKLSDTIEFGHENAYFLHCNPRHHTVGVAEIPGAPKGLSHLMIEVDSLEAVGRALDIVNAADRPVQISLGEHTNDRMTSFYVITPSGFAIEYGWNGKLVDEAHWKVTHYQDLSVWGHHFDPSSMIPRDQPAPEALQNS